MTPLKPEITSWPTIALMIANTTSRMRWALHARYRSWSQENRLAEKV